MIFFEALALTTVVLAIASVGYNAILAARVIPSPTVTPPSSTGNPVPSDVAAQSEPLLLSHVEITVQPPPPLALDPPSWPPLLL